MREIIFYQTASGRSPVEDFILSQADEHIERIGWVLDLLRSTDLVPAQYLKKLSGTNGLWELRVQSAGNAFRLLCFFDGTRLVVVVNGFAKKTEKVPTREIAVADERRKDYLARKRSHG